MSGEKGPRSPRLAKSHTFAARPVKERDEEALAPEVSLPSASGVPGRHAVSDRTIRPAATTSNERDSILRDTGSRYAYGVAEGAAFNASEPWKVAAAVGRDVGQFVLGRIGWTPSSAEVEHNDSKFQHETCSIMRARLKVQAEARAAEEAARRQTEGADAVEAARAVNDEQNSGPDNVKPEQHSDDQESLDGDDDEKGKLPPDGTTDPTDDLNRVSVSSSYATGDIVTSGSGHYDPANDALLRLETMTPAEVRFLNFALWSALTVALAFLVFEFTQKLYDENATVKTYNSVIINSVMGGVCFLMISISLCCHISRIVASIRHGKVWRPRRKKFLGLVTIELVAQWLNLLFFLLPNLESFGSLCFRIRSNQHVAYFALVRWTAWNTLFLVSLIHAHNSNSVSRERALSSSLSQESSLQRRKKLQETRPQDDVAVLDLPFLTAHWWKLIIWLLMECSVVACIVYYATTVGHGNPDNAHVPQTHNCAQRYFDCRVSNTALGLVSLLVFFSLLYFLLYCYYVQNALKQLQRKSNTDFKIANVIVRLQMRLRLPAFGFFMLSLFLLWYVKPFSCASLIDTWLGMLPGQLAVTTAVLLITFVGTPKSCGGAKPILQVWLQEFAWTEEEKSHKLTRRNSSLPPEQIAEIEKEPMFCVETMMRCLYWSLLIYDYEEVPDSKLSLEEACGLFNPPLEQFELFWEKSLDTKMILAWNREKVMLVFRGTASLANVVADLQAWRGVHEPKRGPWWNRPKVHMGFQKAWRNNDLNARVLKRLTELLRSGEIDKEKLTMTVTGHSLGGALATLASYDVRALGRKYGSDCKVACYTFGAPRTGNHAFAKDFQDMVPDCWHIINDQDVVARGAKFWVLFKRGGHRVLINPLGDLIVRPNAMEASLRLVPCSGSVQQHLLTSYLQSLLAVLLSQFSKKRIRGGMSGVVQLAKDNTAIKRLLMEEAGLTFNELVYMSRWGTYAPRVAEIAALPVTARRRTGGKDLKDRKLDTGKAASTRGGLFGCCRPTAVKVNKASGGDEVAGSGDASVVDGKA